MTPITYLSEQPTDYARAIDGAETLADLRIVLADWRALAQDAENAALKMTNADFTVFREGLKKERKGCFAGEDFVTRFGDILMPAVMFKVSIHASEFHVPFGLMYIRLRELNKLPSA